MNLRLALLSALLLSAGHVRAQVLDPSKPIVIFSRSGQFAIQGLPLNKPSLNLAPPSGVSYARLDPALLAFSAENIKQALLSTLGLTDRWQGRIRISLYPVSKDNEE